MSDINPYELFKFIQSDVTNEKLFEATDSAYKDISEREPTPGQSKAWECSAGSLRDVYYVATAEEAKEEFESEHGRKCTNVKDVSEGKLYKNLNNIDDPEEAIQSLKEDEEPVDEKKDKHPDSADNPAIKTDGAGPTEKPEITEINQRRIVAAKKSSEGSMAASASAIKSSMWTTSKALISINKPTKNATRCQSSFSKIYSSFFPEVTIITTAPAIAIIASETPSC